MQAIISGKNIDVTPALREHLERKLAKVEKMIADAGPAQVTLSVEKDRHIVEVTLPVAGYMIRAEEVEQDMYAAADLVIDKLERQIRKYKTRIAQRRRNGKAAARPNAAAAVGEPAADDDTEQVVKVKRFRFKPETVDEALLQMNLLGHQFYVFTDADTEQVSVLYRRHDGNYGLIQSEA